MFVILLTSALVGLFASALLAFMAMTWIGMAYLIADAWVGWFFWEYHWQWVVLIGVIAAVNAVVLSRSTEKTKKRILIVTIPVVYLFTLEQASLVTKMLTYEWDMTAVLNDWEAEVFNADAELAGIPEPYSISGQQVLANARYSKRIREEAKADVFSLLPEVKKSSEEVRDIIFVGQRESPSDPYNTFTEPRNLGRGASLAEVCHLFKHPLFSVGPEKYGPEFIDVRDLVFQYSQQFPVLTPRYEKSKARFTSYEMGTDKPSKPYHGMKLSDGPPGTFRETPNSGKIFLRTGVLIESVEEGSPADLAGLKAGMRIAMMKGEQRGKPSGVWPKEPWGKLNANSPAKMQEILEQTEPGLQMEIRLHEEGRYGGSYWSQPIYYEVGGSKSDKLYWSELFDQAFSKRSDCLPAPIKENLRRAQRAHIFYPDNRIRPGWRADKVSSESEVSFDTTCLPCIFFTKDYHPKILDLFNTQYLQYQAESTYLEKNIESYKETFDESKTSRELANQLSELMRSEYYLTRGEGLSGQYKIYTLLHGIFFVLNTVFFLWGGITEILKSRRPKYWWDKYRQTL